jgi:hypothetical protein
VALELPCLRRMASLKKKYFNINLSSRPANGPPQTWQVISLSFVSGPASTLTT